MPVIEAFKIEFDADDKDPTPAEVNIFLHGAAVPLRFRFTQFQARIL